MAQEREQRERIEKKNIVATLQLDSQLYRALLSLLISKTMERLWAVNGEPRRVK
jgi:hypothetical protein